MNTCKQCGEELENEVARFCSECGAPVTNSEDAAPEKKDEEETPPQVETEIGPKDAEEPGEGAVHSEKDHPQSGEPDVPGDEGTPFEEHADKYKEAVEDAWEDGVIDEKDRRQLDSVREELSITDSKAAGMEEEARKAVTSGGRDHGDPDMSVVELQINDSRFYMEKRMAVLDFAFVNKSDRRIPRAELSIKSPQFKEGEKSCTVYLRPHQRRVYKLQIHASVAGEHLTNLTLKYKFDGVERAFTAQQTFQVLDENLTPQNLTLNIDQSLKAGGDIGYGNSVRNQVKEDIHKGVVKTVNDLITRKYEPNWQQITLDPDESVAAASRPVKIVDELTHEGEEIDRACLMYGCSYAAFISDEKINMGRNRRDNDIMLRLLPRSVRNDEYTLKISRTHIILKLDKDGLKLVDNDTTMGSTVNGEKVEGEVCLPLEKPSEVNVASVMSLKITPLLAGKSGVSRQSRYKSLGRPGSLWRLAKKHGLRAVKLERMGNLGERECYVIIYRWMNIGQTSDSEFLKPEEGVPVFRLLRFADRFWLESISHAAEINGVQVEPGDAAPLGTDMEIMAGNAEAQFCKFSQRD